MTFVNRGRTRSLALRCEPDMPTVDAGHQHVQDERSRIRQFYSLTKPRVVELLLVVTAPTMILATGGIPDLWLVLATLIGGAFSAGSCAVQGSQSTCERAPMTWSHFPPAPFVRKNYVSLPYRRHRGTHRAIWRA